MRSVSPPSGSLLAGSRSASRMSLMRSIVARMSVTASAGDRHAVAELAHQGFGGVRQRLKARQPEKPAGALDGVNQAEDVAEDLGVVRLLLETHQLDIDPSRLSLVSVTNSRNRSSILRRPGAAPHDAAGAYIRLLAPHAQRMRVAVARRGAPERIAPSLLPKGLISVANAVRNRAKSRVGEAKRRSVRPITALAF